MDSLNSLCEILPKRPVVGRNDEDSAVEQTGIQTLKSAVGNVIVGSSTHHQLHAHNLLFVYLQYCIYPKLKAWMEWRKSEGRDNVDLISLQNLRVVYTVIEIVYHTIFKHYLVRNDIEIPNNELSSLPRTLLVDRTFFEFCNEYINLEPLDNLHVHFPQILTSWLEIYRFLVFDDFFQSTMLQRNIDRLIVIYFIFANEDIKVDSNTGEKCILKLYPDLCDFAKLQFNKYILNKINLGDDVGKNSIPNSSSTMLPYHILLVSKIRDLIATKSPWLKTRALKLMVTVLVQNESHGLHAVVVGYLDGLEENISHFSIVQSQLATLLTTVPSYLSADHYFSSLSKQLLALITGDFQSRSSSFVVKTLFLILLKMASKLSHRNLYIKLFIEPLFQAITSMLRCNDTYVNIELPEILSSKIDSEAINVKIYARREYTHQNIIFVIELLYTLLHETESSTSLTSFIEVLHMCGVTLALIILFHGFTIFVGEKINSNTLGDRLQRLVQKIFIEFSADSSRLPKSLEIVNEKFIFLDNTAVAGEITWSETKTGKHWQYFHEGLTEFDRALFVCSWVVQEFRRERSSSFHQDKDKGFTSSIFYYHLRIFFSATEFTSLESNRRQISGLIVDSLMNQLPLTVLLGEGTQILELLYSIVSQEYDRLLLSVNEEPEGEYFQVDDKLCSEGERMHARKTPLIEEISEQPIIENRESEKDGSAFELTLEILRSIVCVIELSSDRESENALVWKFVHPLQEILLLQRLQMSESTLLAIQEIVHLIIERKLRLSPRTEALHSSKIEFPHQLEQLEREYFHHELNDLAEDKAMKAYGVKEVTRLYREYYQMTLTRINDQELSIILWRELLMNLSRVLSLVICTSLVDLDSFVYNHGVISLSNLISPLHTAPLSRLAQIMNKAHQRLLFVVIAFCFMGEELFLRVFPNFRLVIRLNSESISLKLEDIQQLLNGTNTREISYRVKAMFGEVLHVVLSRRVIAAFENTENWIIRGLLAASIQIAKRKVELHDNEITKIFDIYSGKTIAKDAVDRVSIDSIQLLYYRQSAISLLSECLIAVNYFNDQSLLFSSINENRGDFFIRESTTRETIPINSSNEIQLKGSIHVYLKDMVDIAVSILSMEVGLHPTTITTRRSAIYLILHLISNYHKELFNQDNSTNNYYPILREILRRCRMTSEKFDEDKIVRIQAQRVVDILRELTKHYLQIPDEITLG